MTTVCLISMQHLTPKLSPRALLKCNTSLGICKPSRSRWNRASHKTNAITPKRIPNVDVKYGLSHSNRPMQTQNESSAIGDAGAESDTGTSSSSKDGVTTALMITMTATLLEVDAQYMA